MNRSRSNHGDRYCCRSGQGSPSDKEAKECLACFQKRGKFKGKRGHQQTTRRQEHAMLVSVLFLSSPVRESKGSKQERPHQKKVRSYCEQRLKDERQRRHLRLSEVPSALRGQFTTCLSATCSPKVTDSWTPPL